MNIRIALIGTALAAGTALLASPASARAIRTDTGDVQSCAPSTGQLPFSSGLTGTPDACSFVAGTFDDQEPDVGPYEADSTTVYTWDDDNMVNWNNSVQVVVYSLDGNFGDGSSSIPVAPGDTEIAFDYNYDNGTANLACLVNPPALSSTPTLSFDGKTYQFTGANGAGICDATSTSDFVFNSISYVGWIDENNMLQTGSGGPPPLPRGWSMESTSVPEPDSWALTLIGGSLVAVFAVGRRRRANR